MENRPHSREKRTGEGSVGAERGRRVNTGGPLGGSSQSSRPGPSGVNPQRGARPRRFYGSQGGGGPRRSGGIGIFGIILIVLLLSRCGGSFDTQSIPAATPRPTSYVTAAPSHTLAPQNESVEAIDDTNMPFSGGLLQDLPGVQSTPKPTATAKPSATPRPASAASPVRDKRFVPLGGGRDTVTVMIYMCGTDLESKYGMATSDLTEMAKANLSDKVNVIVETGGCKHWKNNIVSSSANQIYRVHDGGLERLESRFGNAAMTDPANLSKFIQYCGKNFPANRNILILWDHGGGSISGYGYDEKTGGRASMTLPQIDEALKDGGVTFDWIGYDACLMSTLETALVSADYADYLIASEEVEPGTGWYYTDWLNNLSRNTSISTEALGKNIIDTYVSACRQRSYNAQVTLAMTDLAMLQSRLPASFRDFSISTNEMISGDEYQQVSDARAGARQFAQSTRINQVDLADLALRMGTDEGRALAQTIQDCVKYNGTTITRCYGLSVYFPYESMSSVSSAINTYDTLGLDEEYAKVIKSFASLEYGGQVGGYSTQGSYGSFGGYGDLLETLLGSYSYAGSSSYGGSPYGSGSPAGSLSGSYTNAYGQNSAGYTIDMNDIFGLLSAFSGRSLSGDLAWVDTQFIADHAKTVASSFLDPGRITVTNKDGVPVLKLTEEEWALIQTVELNVFVNDGEGYIDLGLDNTFSFDDDGDMLLDFDGTWLTLDGKLAAYYLVSDNENPDGSWTTIGRIPVLLNGDLMNLQVVFDEENPYGAVTGAYPFYENGETETSPKGLVPLQRGDKIEFLCDFYGYDGSYQSSHVLGTALTVTGNLKLENFKITNPAVPSFRITDIYGNHYWLAF